MIRSTLLAIACSMSVPTTTSADTTYYSYAFGKQFVVEIIDDKLKASPSWTKEEGDPPLTARKAIAIASEQKDSLVKDDERFKWRLKALSLIPWSDDKWYWLIDFEAVRRGGSTGVPNHLRLVVLMDGTVITPLVSVRPQ